MKKIIIAAAIILTSGLVSTNVKSVKANKAAVAIDKSVLGTAD